MTTDTRPDFRRVRRALMLDGEPDRIALFDTVDRGIMSAWLGKPVSDLASIVEFRVKAGYDYVPLGVDLWSQLKKAKGGKGAPAGQSKQGQYSLYVEKGMPGEPLWGSASDRSDDARATEERVWATEGKGIITSVKELEDFPWPRVEEMDFSPFEQLEGLMPQGMKAIAHAGHIFTTVWTLMGLETFSLSLSDDPGLVAAIFQRAGDIQYQVVDRVTKFGAVGAVMFPDDIAYTSGLMVSPRHLRKYHFPLLEQMCALCWKRDKPVIYHSDGKLDVVLEDIIAAGVNALHPIQPNAMDIADVKAKVGGRLCLLGNIDLDVLARGTPSQVEALVRKNLREIAPGGGYCVGSSNSIADYVKIENFNAMRKTVFKYGNYPIGA
ncbi:MAG: nucleoside 2-deoxyribosyltransferase [Chloroflexi bacterium]|nr:nucleoside 2-deoxyribosyltransferase [Chloroflexota bacterium]